MIFFRDPVIAKACAISAEVLTEELRVERLVSLIRSREGSGEPTESAVRALQAAIWSRNVLILELFPKLRR